MLICAIDFGYLVIKYMSNYLTKEILITKKSNPLDYEEARRLMTLTRKLRNECLYHIRTKYFNSSFDKSKRSLKVFDPKTQKEVWSCGNVYLYHKFKNSENFKANLPDSDKATNTKILKQVFINVNDEFSSYFEAIKSYAQNPSKFTGYPKIPSYSKKYYKVTVPKEALSSKNKGYVTIAITSSNIKIPLCCIDFEKIKQITIISAKNGIKFCIVYDEGVKPEPIKHEDVTRAISIDLGVKNFCTLTSNDRAIHPKIISGSSLNKIAHKSMHLMAGIQSEIAVVKQDKTISNKEKRTKLYFLKNRKRKAMQKREDRMKSELHLISSYIISYLKENNIECLIVGRNKGWKQKVNMGRKNNRNFTSLPYFQFQQQLKYKCEQAGILYIETEESYTSKCSFIDLEPICKQVNYMGSRYSRGLFRSSNGSIINADVNGSYNILRKILGDDQFVSIGTNTFGHHARVVDREMLIEKQFD